MSVFRIFACSSIMFVIAAQNYTAAQQNYDDHPTLNEEISDHLEETGAEIEEQYEEIESNDELREALREEERSLYTFDEALEESNEKYLEVAQEALQSIPDAVGNTKVIDVFESGWETFGLTEKFKEAYGLPYSGLAAEERRQAIFVELEELDAESQALQMQVSQNIAAAALVALIANATTQEIQTNRPAIFEQVSAAYDRIFAVAENRAAERERNRRSSGGSGSREPARDDGPGREPRDRDDGNDTPRNDSGSSDDGGGENSAGDSGGSDNGGDDGGISDGEGPEVDPPT